MVKFQYIRVELRELARSFLPSSTIFEFVIRQRLVAFVETYWHPNGEPLSHCVDNRHKKLAAVKAKALKKHARRKQATAGTHYA